ARAAARAAARSLGPAAQLGGGARAGGSPMPAPVTLIAGLPFAEAHGRPLRLDLVLPTGAADGARPAVVWVPGNGWEGTRAEGLDDWCCPLLAAHGFV